MNDMWSHSHEWDNGYAVGHKDGYQQGKEEADTFLKQWKDDVVNSLAKYDANSVEEVYQYGINRGRADAIEPIMKGYKELVELKNLLTKYFCDVDLHTSKTELEKLALKISSDGMQTIGWLVSELDHIKEQKND